MNTQVETIKRDILNISEHIGAVRALNDLLDDIENMM